MLKVNQLNGFNSVSRSPIEITQTANPVPLTVSGTSGTFSTISIGTSVLNRYIVVCVGWRGTNRPLTSFSINTGSGAVNMTLAAGNGQNENKYAAIYYASVPENATTADFVATFGGNLGNPVKITVYRISPGPFGILSFSGTTDTSNDMDITDPLTVSLTIPTRGGAIAVASSADDVTAKTWTGLTKDVDEDIGPDRYTTAFGVLTGSVTVTCYGTTNGEAGYLACITINPVNV